MRNQFPGVDWTASTGEVIGPRDKHAWHGMFPQNDRIRNFDSVEYDRAIK
ncbi:hypothetical protein [Pararhodobacter sp. SW119]|nr:hypothetical protein [Pararhodobacter sp. SW119]